MSFNTFTPNTVISSSKVNENFSNALHLTDLQKMFNKITVPAVVSSSSDAFNLDNGSWFVRTLDGSNGTLSLSSEDTDQIFVVELVQDATGSRTVTWFSGIKWVDNVTPTLSTQASRRDVFGFKVLSAGSYMGFIIGQNVF